MCVYLKTQHCSGKGFTHYTIFTPLSSMLGFCFQHCVGIIPRVLLRCTKSKQEGWVHVWCLKDILLKNKPTWSVLQLVTVLPVTTDVDGTSQVNVTMVPSWLGNKLESEIIGPGKRGIVSEIKRWQERGGWGETKTGELCLKGKSNLRDYLAPCLRVHCFLLLWWSK